MYKLTIWTRHDDEGHPCPILMDGKVYPFIGELHYGEALVVTAWGETSGDVFNQLREHQLKMEGRL